MQEDRQEELTEEEEEKEDLQEEQEEEEEEDEEDKPDEKMFTSNVDFNSAASSIHKGVPTRGLAAPLPPPPPPRRLPPPPPRSAAGHWEGWSSGASSSGWSQGWRNTDAKAGCRNQWDRTAKDGARIKFLEDNPKPLTAKMKAYSESACARRVRCLAFTTGHG